MKRHSFVIGITGGTGCGKTTLLNMIGAAGGLILDCDAVYHQLLAADAALQAAIEQRFPDTVSHGTLNRKALGRIVFTDPAALNDLNRIAHGAIRNEVVSQLSAHTGPAAIDAIALFESGLAQLCDVTVAVVAPIEDRVCRIMARDNISEEYARARIAAQPDDDWFRCKCNYTLENNGSQDVFSAKCIAFLKEIGIIESY